MNLEDIRKELESSLVESLNRCGLMYRVFSRVKTMHSLNHKMHKYGDVPRKRNIQDLIGLRIVLYFPEDVELMAFYYSCKDLVRKSVDVPDTDTFKPQRLNLTKNLPEELVSDFRECLPVEFAQYIDNTYEVQIRTVFSEGWHEVEHDMRYKCKEDWEDYGRESRVLNGLIATLETAEWNMCSLFKEMAQKNFERNEFRAMLRNKLHIRFADSDFSQKVNDFLATHHEVVEQFYNSDRIVFLISLLNHKQRLPLTYDNIVFLMNRIDIGNNDLLLLEKEMAGGQIEQFLQS